MGFERRKDFGIALNVTRTYVTVLVFNLTIIALTRTVIAVRGTGGDPAFTAHLSSWAALYVGFSLTLLGIVWLLISQDWDPEGLSRPWPFVLGALTTYLAGAQTITAVMHEFLRGVKWAFEASRQAVVENAQASPELDALGDIAGLVLYTLGAAIWIAITYAAPLIAVLKSPVRRDRRWLFVAYYLANLLPIYWVYASTYYLQAARDGESANLANLFFLQFVQPLLWFY
ncbi:MAG: hypothetical protein QNJ92_03945 [Alphaproteobacteria bacterium]|nr:hypothetical protein [Alphaproteobacteria bacterium]